MILFIFLYYVIYIINQKTLFKSYQRNLIRQGLMDSLSEAEKKAQGKALKTLTKAHKTGEEKSKFRQFDSPNGFKVLIGRTSNENDELSIRVAKAKDMWFHVNGLPGSHTVLRHDKQRGDFKDEDMEFAANLAAFYSKVIVDPIFNYSTFYSI